MRVLRVIKHSPTRVIFLLLALVNTLHYYYFFKNLLCNYPFCALNLLKKLSISHHRRIASVAVEGSIFFSHKARWYVSDLPLSQIHVQSSDILPYIAVRYVAKKHFRIAAIV